MAYQIRNTHFGIACICMVACLFGIVSKYRIAKFSLHLNTRPAHLHLSVFAGKEACNMTFPVTSRKTVYNSSRDDCKSIRRGSSNAFPMTALASYPGSGNTWFRHLVQQATGIATGSIYCDNDLRAHGFPHECVRDRSVILVKTHNSDSVLESHYQKAVLIIRDPGKALEAEFNRQHHGHVGHASNIQFQREFETFWRRAIRKWHQFNLKWLKFRWPLHVVRYEDLQRNLVDEMQRVFSFLNVTISSCDMACMVVNREGRFHRTVTNSERVNLTRNSEIDTFIEKAYTEYNMSRVRSYKTDLATFRGHQQKG